LPSRETIVRARRPCHPACRSRSLMVVAGTCAMTDRPRRRRAPNDQSDGSQTLDVGKNSGHRSSSQRQIRYVLKPPAKSISDWTTTQRRSWIPKSARVPVQEFSAGLFGSVRSRYWNRIRCAVERPPLLQARPGLPAVHASDCFNTALTRLHHVTSRSVVLADAPRRTAKDPRENRRPEVGRHAPWMLASREPAS